NNAFAASGVSGSGKVTCTSVVVVPVKLTCAKAGAHSHKRITITRTITFPPRFASFRTVTKYLMRLQGKNEKKGRAMLGQVQQGGMKMMQKTIIVFTNRIKTA
ncbi:MAG: hypothetical protein ABJ034_15195, partial [Hyphomicrobiales bacterium]